MLTSHCDKMAIGVLLLCFSGCVQCGTTTSLGFANPYYQVRWLPNAHVLPMQNEDVRWNCVYRSHPSRDMAKSCWALYGSLSLCPEEIQKDLRHVDAGMLECSQQCLNEIYARATALPSPVAFSGGIYRCFFMTCSGRIRICTMTENEFAVVYKGIFTKGYSK